MAKDALHARGRRQSWSTVDIRIGRWLTSIVEDLRPLLIDDLVGVYLHGSLAMGCYYAPKSDADLLVVAAEALPAAKRREVAAVFLRAHDNRPATGGLEVSVVTADAARSFVHPMPFEVHFSTKWAGPTREDSVDFEANRVDPDLAAHVTVTRARGTVLYGPPPSQVFGPVPFADYVASIRDDLEWILEDENVVTSPFYGVLNACRVLIVLIQGEGCVPSKEEAGDWALRELPGRHRPVVEQALACYRSEYVVKEDERQRHGHDWDQGALLSFRDYVRTVMSGQTMQARDGGES